MQFDLNDFSREVYAVSVAHGWHDPEPTPAETIALIHSEWSEALQAYRNKEPMYEYWQADSRPDGIAVELIDGCLRILDLFGAKKFLCEWDRTCFPYSMKKVIKLPALVTGLHAETADAYDSESDDIRLERNRQYGLYALADAVTGVFEWLTNQDIDPYAVMLIKHEYNKTRPYRHGGKLC